MSSTSVVAETTIDQSVREQKKTIKERRKRKSEGKNRERTEETTKGVEEDEEMVSVKWAKAVKVESNVRNGIRYIQPYWSFFRGYAKRRWVGRTISEIFATEFAVLHPLYAKAACRKGRILVNGSAVPNVDYRVRHNDLLLHICHRHETEIPDLPIEIIAETDDVLVLNKPAGLPVHSCGNYNLHTVVGRLRYEYGREGMMRPCYRLDRTTTGLLMLAKNEGFDVKFKAMIKNRAVQKEYLCKVEGKFPDGEVVCDANIGVLSHHIGLRCVRPEGQKSLSRFRRLHFCAEDNTSLLSCRIETGRTHQIRVHLQYLGHPIVGDSYYNDELWGPTKGKGADYGEQTFEQLCHSIRSKHTKKGWIIDQDPNYEQRIREIGDDELHEPEEHNPKGLQLEEMAAWDSICWDCSIRKKREMTEQNQWLLPLHCWRYSGDGWAFEAPLPNWANEKLEMKLEEKMGGSGKKKGELTEQRQSIV